MSSKRLKSDRQLSKKQKKDAHPKACFRSDYSSENFRNNFQAAYTSDRGRKLDGTEAEIIKNPFTCAVLPNFIEDGNFLDGLLDELTDLPLNEKNNDLYKFHQSDDLQAVSSPAVTALRELLYGEFRQWLTDMTGIKLNDTVDMNFSRYEYTDVLLCHDDQLEGRRIAYILYLVSPSWCEEDGGTLDLFDTDDNSQPNVVVKSVVPKRNSFVFFQVSPTSFHQVSEVKTEDRIRLSVSGWFHGPPLEHPTPFLEPSANLDEPGSIAEEMVRSWISPSYLEKEVQLQIQEKFQNDSEIELKGFLQSSKYEELAAALKDDGLCWKTNGPANRRRFEELDRDKVPSVIQEFLQLVGSEAMFLVLSNLTGLTLHRLAETNSDTDEEDEKEAKSSTPRWRCSVRQWSSSCYTLVHDDDKSLSETALDATFYFNCADWTPEYGGYTSYIAKGEDEELLSVCPNSNSVALVFRDPETLKFIKHINSKVNERLKEDRCFQDVFCVYYE